MAKQKFYITTAIDYVNARPHVGHAFEKTLADALARYKRLYGYDVFFLTGVDENAQKNVEAAQKAGIPAKEFIDKNTSYFMELCKKLNLSHNDFIRTTAKEHVVVVQKLVKKMTDKEDIYKGVYEGLYCVGCETYYTEKDLIDGKCPEHNTKPELRKEEAYFFKLSRYKPQLLKIIPEYVVPKSKANESITRINEELNDICISRKGAKWGIDFPFDTNFKIWVWIDALINYISGLKDREKKYWPADVHIIGKGINWFHSVIWPALLLSAEYKLPKALLVHGYLTIGDKKISKSVGNVIDPLELLKKYSSDSIRYSFLRCSVFEDSDYSEEILIRRNNDELADKLGNLISRVSTLAEKYSLEKAKPLDFSKVQKAVEGYMENYEFDKALNEIFLFIDQCNEYTQRNKPWETQDKKVLWQLANAIKDFTILLSPFMPIVCEQISKTFNFEISLKSLAKPLTVTKIKKSDILIRKIEMPKKELSQKEAKAIASAKEPTSMPAPPAPNTDNTQNHLPPPQKLSYKDFAKLDLKVGKITNVDDHPDADKLYILEVDMGKDDKRIIVAGLRKHYTRESLIGKKAIFVANLQPVTIRGVQSDGMILAAVSDDESQVIILSPDKDIKEGSKVL